jgi:adenine-specific DNA-methyltransferase
MGRKTRNQNTKRAFRTTAKLQRSDIIRSPKLKKRPRKKRPSQRVVLLDAFEFLKGLKPESVDLIVSSPPYCMGKEYEKTSKVEDFTKAHEALAPLLMRVLRQGGSLCWQIGHHVQNGVVTPLDAIVYPILARQTGLLLRNRIVWTFGHGVHASRRLSGRHETILWFTKGNDYHFDLDKVRVPQKYPGKRHYKGPNKGKLSGNPRGKNPSDVWEIPNVKSKHPEKTIHPCQFPIALVQRLIRSLCPINGTVIDPFTGSGTVAAASAIEGRSFLGSDNDKRYIAIANSRLQQAINGSLEYRPIDRPIYVPRPTDAVAIRPRHFLLSQP